MLQDWQLRSQWRCSRVLCGPAAATPRPFTFSNRSCDRTKLPIMPQRRAACSAKDIMSCCGWYSAVLMTMHCHAAAPSTPCCPTQEAPPSSLSSAYPMHASLDDFAPAPAGATAVILCAQARLQHRDVRIHRTCRAPAQAARAWSVNCSGVWEQVSCQIYSIRMMGATEPRMACRARESTCG